MKKILISLLAFSLLAFNGTYALTVSSAEVSQGDPEKIEVQDLKTGEIINSVAVDSKNIFFSKDKLGKYYALYGAGLNLETGTKTLTVSTNLNTYTFDLLVKKRVIKVEDFTIPNSVPTAEYLKTLAKENAMLAVTSSKYIILKDNFVRPLKNIFVTDTYGYSRNMNGESSVNHKGVDYRSETGYRVYAINKGIVRVAKKFSIYGNTVIIDHGNGLISMYMHLSRIDVKPGYWVSAGQKVGLTGATGYVTGPHLHLSIKLNNESIDPEKFFEVMGVK